MKKIEALLKENISLEKPLRSVLQQPIQLWTSNLFNKIQLITWNKSVFNQDFVYNHDINYILK